MISKDYEHQEASEWLGKQPHSMLQVEDLARYGRRLYNQRGNDDINIIRNSIGIDEATKDFLIDRIKKLNR